MVGLVLVNLTALLVLFFWFGTLLGPFGAIVSFFGELAFPQLAVRAHNAKPYISPVLLFLLGASIWLWWKHVYAYGLRSWRTLPVALLILAASGPALRILGRSSGWERPTLVVALLGVAVSVLLAWLARRLSVRGPVALVVNLLALTAPRLLAVAVLAVTAAWWYRAFYETFLDVSVELLVMLIVLYFASLTLGLWFSYIPNRASLHREYRDRLASCFGVVRAGQGVEQVQDAPLSRCKPQEGVARYPRLLVCATANVRVPGATGDGRWFAPFIMSHDQCGVPGHVDATFTTQRLELIKVPRAFGMPGSEPVLSLFTSVAAAGAAWSPFMGRETRPILRLLCILLNVRLGRWLPNVFPAATRAVVEVTTTPRPLWSWLGERGVEIERFVRWFRPSFTWSSLKRPILVGAMSPGFDELIPEMLGLQGPAMYLTDGGHYDNLGLLALLRTKCAEIWCVDSSPDRRGVADELERVLKIAELEMQITNDIDRTRFAVGEDGLNGATHMTGRLVYQDHTVAQVHILKLGLTLDSPRSLKERRKTDPEFPWRPTWKQWYTQDRMDAYRRLGWDITERCLDEMA